MLVLLKDDQDLFTLRLAIRRALFDLAERLGITVGPIIMRWSDIHDNVGLMRNVARDGTPL